MDIKEELLTLRKEIFLTGYAGGAAHLASAFSMVEIMYALYLNGVLRYRAEEPLWEDRDRLIISKGHGSLAVYAVLARAGFFSREELRTFCRPHSRLGGEPLFGETPGIETTTGSLGHGLPFATGIALALKQDKPDLRTYVIIGDGECQEGSMWEAAMTAAKYRLENLIAVMDCNGLQKMGSVQDILGIDNWKTRWESFGWDVVEADGHSVPELTETLLRENHTGKPRLILANTVKGKGSSLMENNPKWHWRMPNKRERKKFMEELHISEEEIAQCKELT